MMPLLNQTVGQTTRIIVAVACCIGIWQSLGLARADFLFKQDTEPSVRAAIRLVPDEANYYMRLSEFDRVDAKSLLTESLRLNRYNAQADIELGLQYEADGDFARAEKQLLEAFDVDHTYMPRWSLANFYFRQNRHAGILGMGPERRRNAQRRHWLALCAVLAGFTRSGADFKGNPQ